MSVFKDKKRGTWSFHGYYRDATNVRRQYLRRGYATKKEAKEAEHAFLQASMKVRPSITLDDLVLNYHANYQTQGIKEATLFTNESYYKTHIKNDLGKVKINKFTTPMVSEWLAKLAKKKKSDGSLYAPATINKCKDVLSKYLTYATRMGFIEYNPCHAVPLFKRDDVTKTINFWEYSTYEKFMSSIEDNYWRLVFAFLFGTGVREGELFALKWSDIDFDKARCSINKTLTYKTGGNGWAITSPKTKTSVRTLDLQDSLLEPLKNHYENEQKKDGFNDAYFVFGDIRPLARTTLARKLDEYIKLADVPRITPHGFRHSHASYLIKSGKIDDQLIAERLGHTVVELRHTYAHIYAEARHDLRSELNKIF